MTDGRAPHQASGAENTVSFAQAGEPVFSFDKMVERTEEQNRIGGGVALRQPARVSHVRRGNWMVGLLRGCRPSLLHMPGHRIDQVDLIAAGSEPAGVSTRASTSVDDPGWSSRQMAENQFPGTGLFKLKPAGAKARGFVDVAVVTNNFADGIVVAHGGIRAGRDRLGARPAVGYAIAQLHGDMARRIFQSFHNARHGLRIHLANSFAQTHASLDRALLVEHRSAHAPGSEIVLLVVDGVALSAHLLQFLQQTWKRSDGFGRALLHGSLGNYFLESFLRDVF